MDAAADFYFESISQIVMDTWVRGGSHWSAMPAISPGPAIRCGTSPAMVGANVLAQELARAGREPGCAPTRTGCATWSRRLAASDPPPCPR